MRSIPVWNYWLRHVKGIGPGLAASILALLLPPLPDKGPSSWYKAAGLAPVEIEGQSRLPRACKGGGKLEYHPRLRRNLWLVGQSFVRVGGGGYYRTHYEQVKGRLIRQHAGNTEWPPHRIDSVARWNTVKVFLAHLWEAWCECEAIPARKPYIIEYGGPQHSYIPRPLPKGDGTKI